jgi:hypothetical protein
VRRDNCIGSNGVAAIVDALGPSRRHILGLLPAIIHTPDVYEYKPILKRPQSSRLLEFEVDASNDAHVRLSLEEGRMFEVVIGGWNNKQSVIRSVAQGSPITRPFAGTVLAAGEFKR